MERFHLASHLSIITIMSYTVNGVEVIEDDRKGNFKQIKLSEAGTLPSGVIGDLIYSNGKGYVYTSDGWKTLGAAN